MQCWSKCCCTLPNKLNYRSHWNDCLFLLYYKIFSSSLLKCPGLWAPLLQIRKDLVILVDKTIELRLLNDVNIIFFNQTGMYLYGIYLSTIFSCINLCWFLLVQINVITHVTARNSTSPNNKKKPDSFLLRMKSDTTCYCFCYLSSQIWPDL